MGFCAFASFPFLAFGTLKLLVQLRLVLIVSRRPIGLAQVDSLSLVGLANMDRHGHVHLWRQRGGMTNGIDFEVSVRE